MQRNQNLKDVSFTLFFGVVSVVLGLIQFNVPGVVGANADLREIPLLISLFYISSPYYVLVLSLITAASALFIPGATFVSTFLMHLVGLAFAWVFYRFLRKLKFPMVKEALLWMASVFIYYTALVIPVLVWSEINIVGQDVRFEEMYLSIMRVVVFEMIPTALVSGLYLVQYNARTDLQKHKEDLELTVQKRTQELRAANNELQMLNEELISSNEEIGALNENLEKIVEERTRKINLHLNQLNQYAHMNAHEVRAPLARILGLLHLLNMENDIEKKENYLRLVYVSSEELDCIIKKMNKLLETDQV